MKAKLILVTSLALMLATAGTTFAANGNGQGACDGTGTGQGGTGERLYENCQGTGDADGDGVCDVGGGTHPQDGSGLRHGGRTR